MYLHVLYVLDIAVGREGIKKKDTPQGSPPVFSRQSGIAQILLILLPTYRYIHAVYSML